MAYLNSFNLIHQSQSGFRAGHSTETDLLLMTERWLKALNEGKAVGSVMVDFRKAFDFVDHDLLLEKFACYNTNNNNNTNTNKFNGMKHITMLFAT